METVKKDIEITIQQAVAENKKLCSSLKTKAFLTDYAALNGIWTNALQEALSENEIVVIPKNEQPYVIDGSIAIPSNRHIIAENGAVIRLKDECPLLMMRNSLSKNGTHAPIFGQRSRNITIEGGVWQDWCEHRLGYGKSGLYDMERSFYGVSAFMLFNNIDNLTLRGMTFEHCGGFAVQLGDISRAIIEDITFINCFADGIHINGNANEIFVSEIRGDVGDDLVAFNMYDWQNSSINFGPCESIICQDLSLSESSYYKALRIQPGIYTYDDGTQVDCSLKNAIFRRINGIKTFKLYCQTPPYQNGEAPENGGVGSGDNIFFEDIKINLDAPIDLLDEYVNSHPVKGTFAAFELGLNVKRLSLKNIDFTVNEAYPMAYLLCIGPKSASFSNGAEVFDPYFSSELESLYLENITINGKMTSDVAPYVKEIDFRQNGFNSLGKIKRIISK